MEKQEKIFGEGLFVKEPREGSPDFVKGSISIKVEEFKAFLDEQVNEKGYVNLDIKVGKSGKWYRS